MSVKSTSITQNIHNIEKCISTTIRRIWLRSLYYFFPYIFLTDDTTKGKLKLVTLLLRLNDVSVYRTTSLCVRNLLLYLICVEFNAWHVVFLGETYTLVYLHLSIMCLAHLEHTHTVAIYRLVIGVWSPVHLNLVKIISVYGHQSIVRVLIDSKYLALTVSVGILFHNFIPDGNKANL